MLALMPANFVVTVFVKRWQVEQMRLKDERLKISSSSGIPFFLNTMRNKRE